MGKYFNPGNGLFEMALNSEIYVDKSRMIAYTNSVLCSEQRFICVSRPRRFGKSMTINMLAAYYSKGCDSKELFADKKIVLCESYEKHRNKYQVLYLNMQEFLSKTKSVEDMFSLITRAFVREVRKEYPEIDFLSETDLGWCMADVYEESQIPFVVLIDEWDCIFREYKENKEEQKRYLDLLRDILKDKPYIALAYMTGILPIKKYGTHSALNMFDEYAMTNPGKLAEFVGFTAEEVKELCEKYHMDYEEAKNWYNGYVFSDNLEIYSPKSVVSAMMSGRYSDYWNQTENFEALKMYIQLNLGGLKDAVIRMLAGFRERIDVRSYVNDMTTFGGYEDVLTLLIHLGYLAYDIDCQEVYIPNKEISKEFVTAIGSVEWGTVARSIKKSDLLLEAILKGDEQAVALGIEQAHYETSILQYNDENALSYTISLALYAAREYYTVIRELPTGKGFADMVFLPKKNHMDKPVLLVELKWDKDADAAIRQIEEKRYTGQLQSHGGKIIMAGISYDKDTKKHECMIRQVKTIPSSFSPDYQNQKDRIVI